MREGGRFVMLGGCLCLVMLGDAWWVLKDVVEDASAMREWDVAGGSPKQVGWRGRTRLTLHVTHDPSSFFQTRYWSLPHL